MKVKDIILIKRQNAIENIGIFFQPVCDCQSRIPSVTFLIERDMLT